MKRIVAAVLLVFCFLPQRSWADFTTANTVQVLPLSSGRILVELKSDPPIITEITQNNGVPSIWLKNARLKTGLVLKEDTLSPEVFLRAVPYLVKVEAVKRGTWLEFQSSSPLEITVVTNDEAFQAEAARQLPTYPQWPATATGNNTPEKLINDAYRSFEANHLPEATQALEKLFLSSPEPSKILYQLLGALYLMQENWIKALCLYGQGAHVYPEALGLRYSAMLYQLHQPDKAAQVLSDMLISINIPPDTEAQAQYMLGTIQEERLDYDNALPHLKAASFVFSDSPAVLYNLAIAYEGTHQPQEALATYEKASKYAQGTFSQEIQTQVTRLKAQNDP